MTRHENWRERRMRVEAIEAFPTAPTPEQAMAKYLLTDRGRERYADNKRARASASRPIPPDAMDGGILHEAEQEGLTLTEFLKTSKGRALYQARANLIRGRSRAKLR